MAPIRTKILLTTRMTERARLAWARRRLGATTEQVKVVNVTSSRVDKVTRSVETGYGRVETATVAARLTTTWLSRQILFGFVQHII